MDFEKWTKKSQEAFITSQNMAKENGNSEITQEHLLFSLIAQEDGLIAEILKSLNTDLETILKEVKAKLDRLSKVSGQTSIYIENDLNQALSEAEKQAKAMQDDFVSVEHLLDRKSVV